MVKRKRVENPYTPDIDRIYEEYNGWIDYLSDDESLRTFLSIHPRIKLEFDRIKEDPLFITQMFLRIHIMSTTTIESLGYSDEWWFLDPTKKAVCIAYQYLDNKEQFEVENLDKQVYLESSQMFASWLQIERFDGFDMALFKNNLRVLDGRILNPRRLFNRELGGRI
jgi:hypothetical protein